MVHKGLLVVISGPSGAGKGTIVSQLIKSGGYKLSVSATTRQRREKEKDGVHYFFKTRQQFEKMVQEDQFLEWAEFVDNLYGTPKEYVENELQNGNNVILEIEVQGAHQIKHKMPECVMIFLMAPDLTELERRLRIRATETDLAIQKRIEKAKEEITHANEYDYIVINHSIQDSVKRIKEIVNNKTTKI